MIGSVIPTFGPDMFTPHFGKRLERSKEIAGYFMYQRRLWQEACLEQDYSWEGLALKAMDLKDGMGGVFRVTLQDFWRDEADSLIEAPDGRKYTRFHLPFEVPVGYSMEPTVKAEWDADMWSTLYADLSKRIQNDAVPMEARRVRRAEDLYRPSDPPGFDGIERNLWPVQIDLSGLHLTVNPPALTSKVNIKLNWLYFQSLELVHAHIVYPNQGFDLQNSLVAGATKLDELIAYHAVKFSGCFLIGPVSLRGANVQAVEFDHCRLAFFNFEDASLTSLRVRATILEPHQCSFHHLTVEQNVDLRGSGTALVGAFYNSKIKGRLLIDHEADGYPADKVFKREVIDVALMTTDRPLFTKDPSFKRDFLREGRSRLFRQIEGGALIIKTKLREENFEELAHRFYRYELWARTYNPSTDAGTRGLLTLYRWSSQYGYNVTRPLLWTLALSFALSIVYLFCFTWAQGWTIGSGRLDLSAWRCFGDAWSFSLGRIAPVIPWSAGIPVPSGSLEHTLKTAPGANGLIVHFLGLVQTIASTCLFFLTALAARRRFRMSD